MTAEFRKAQVPDINDPAIRRFASAVLSATKGGQESRNANYKFHRVGELVVAAVNRPFPEAISPVFSTFGQVLGNDETSYISGLQLAIPDPDGIGQDKPKKMFVPGEVLASWIPDEYVEKRLDEALGIAMEGLTGARSNLVLVEDPDRLLDAFESRDNEKADRINKELAFGQTMDAAGLNDADEENVEKVAEGLEIIVFKGRWGKKKRLERAETLFYEGLGLTE